MVFLDGPTVGSLNLTVNTNEEFPAFSTTSHRHASQAETLFPFPDGVRVPPMRRHTVNPSLLRPMCAAATHTASYSNTLHYTRSDLLRLPRIGSNGFTPSPQWTGANFGYWTVTYTTPGGERVGQSRVMAPRGKQPLTFDRIMEAILGTAALHCLVVQYVMYFDVDFDAFAILTPQTAQFCVDTFDVIVTPPLPEGAGRHAAPAPPIPPSAQWAMAAPGRSLALEEKARREALVAEDRVGRLVLRARHSVHAEAVGWRHGRPDGDAITFRVESPLHAWPPSSPANPVGSVTADADAQGACKPPQSRTSTSSPTPSADAESESEQHERRIRRISDILNHATQHGPRGDGENGCGGGVDGIPHLGEDSANGTAANTLTDRTAMAAVSLLTVALGGDGWEPLLQNDACRLQKALLLDLSTCLGVPIGYIAVESCQHDPPVVHVAVQHSMDRSKASLQEAVLQYDFPHIAAAYAEGDGNANVNSGNSVV